MQRIARTLLIAVLLSPGGAPPAAAGGPGGPLTLEKALALAREWSPGLAASRRESEAWAHRIHQEGRRRNPEFGIEVENFGGSGSHGGFESRETTLLLHQTLELGGKREGRVRAAEAEGEIASLAARERALALDREVKIRFADLVEAEERERLASDREHLAGEFLEEVRRRLAAGSGSPADEGNASVALEEARVGRGRAERERERARRALAALWGDPDPGFTGALPSGGDAPLPGWEAIRGRAADGPRVARAVAEGRYGRAVVESARAERVPDLELGGGFRSFAGEEEWAWVAEASVPIPLFDRGRSRVDEAAARTFAAEERERAARAEEIAAARELYDRIAGLEEEGAALSGRLIPEAERALETTRRAFEGGRLPLRDVLAARRALFDPMARVVEVRAEMGRALGALEYVIGVSLSDIPSGEGEE